jgi:hypothetical protein
MRIAPPKTLKISCQRLRAEKEDKHILIQAELVRTSVRRIRLYESIIVDAEWQESVAKADEIVQDIRLTSERGRVPRKRRRINQGSVSIPSQVMSGQSGVG